MRMSFSRPVFSHDTFTLRRSLALWLSVIYFMTNVLYAGGPAGRPAAAPLLPPVTRALPSSGTKDLFRKNPVQTYANVKMAAAPAGPSRKSVTIIQDVHANADAQKNIANIIGVLETQTPRVIGIEGASGFLNFGPYRQLPRQEIVHKTGAKYLETGKLLGSSYAALTHSGAPSLLFGIENPNLYRRNVEATLEADKDRPATLQWLEQMGKRNAADKLTSYGPALKKIDHHMRAFARGELSLGDYVGRLMEFHDLPSSMPLLTFHEAVKMEKRLDFALVERERAEALEILTRKMRPEELKELVDASMAFQKGEISSGEFYRHLKMLLTKHDVINDNRRTLGDYLQYVALAESIKADELLKDLNAYESQIVKDLATTSEQSRIAAESKWLSLARKLVNFELTQDEWMEYNALTPALSLKGEGELASFEDFYRIADARNGAMVENLLRAMGRKNCADGILIAGGFHADGLVDLLNKRGVAVTVLTPKISKLTQGSKPLEYLTIFQREKTPLSRLFHGQKLFLGAIDGLAPGAMLVPAKNIGDQFRDDLKDALQDAGVDEALVDPVLDFQKIKERIRQKFGPEPMVTSRIGHRGKQKDPVELVDSIYNTPLEHPLTKALSRLQQSNPKNYATLVEKISINGTLQIYWAKNLPSAAGLFSMQEEIEGKIITLTGLLLDNDARPVLEAAAKGKSALQKKAVEDLLYLLLVHEAAELATRGGDETLTPNLVNEWKATLEEIQHYYIPPLKFIKTTIQTIHRGPFEALLRKLDRVDRKSKRYSRTLTLYNLLRESTIEEMPKVVWDYLIKEPEFAGLKRSEKIFPEAPAKTKALPKTKKRVNRKRKFEISFPLKSKKRTNPKILTRIISSRLGYKSVAPEGPVTPVDMLEIEDIGAHIKVSLTRLNRFDPELYRVFLERITFNGHPQMYWADNLPSAAGVFSMEDPDNPEGAPITGFLIDSALRPFVEPIEAGNRDRNFARINLMFLLLVHEATELSVRKDGETITPNLVAEVKAILKEADAYRYILGEVEKNDLKKLLREIADTEIGMPDRFTQVLQLWDRLADPELAKEIILGELVELILNAGDVTLKGWKSVKEFVDDFMGRPDPLELGDVIGLSREGTFSFKKHHNHMKISPDGKNLLIADRDGWTLLVPSDFEPGTSYETPSIRVGIKVDDIAFSANGRMVAFAHENGYVTLGKIGVQTNRSSPIPIEEVTSSKINEDGVRKILFTHDDHYLIVFSNSGWVSFHAVIWDQEKTSITELKAPSISYQLGQNFRWWDMAASLDGETLVFGGESLVHDGPLNKGKVVALTLLREPMNGKIRSFQVKWSTPINVAIHKIAISPDNRLLALRGGDEIWIADAPHAKNMRKAPLQGQRSPTPMFLSDNQTLVVESDFGHVEIFHLSRTGQDLKEVKKVAGRTIGMRIGDIAVSPDQSHLFVLDYNDEVIKFDLKRAHERTTSGPAGRSNDDLQEEIRDLLLMLEDWETQLTPYYFTEDHGKKPLLSSIIDSHIATLLDLLAVFPKPDAPTDEEKIQKFPEILTGLLMPFETPTRDANVQPRQRLKVKVILKVMADLLLEQEEPWEADLSRMDVTFIEKVMQIFLLEVIRIMTEEMKNTDAKTFETHLDEFIDPLYPYSMRGPLKKKVLNQFNKQFASPSHTHLLTELPPAYGRGRAPHREKGGINEKIAAAFDRGDAIVIDNSEHRRLGQALKAAAAQQKDATLKLPELIAFFNKTQVVLVQSPTAIPGLYIRGPDDYAVAHFGHYKGRNSIFIDTDVFNFLKENPAQLPALLFYELAKVAGHDQGLAEKIEAAIAGKELSAAVQGFIEEKIEAHPTRSNVIAYYVAREIMMTALISGNAHAYRRALEECAAQAKLAEEKLDGPAEDVLSPIVRLLRWTDKLLFNNKGIGDDLELVRVQEEQLTKAEKKIIAEETDMFLEALGFDEELQKDLARKIKLITYPLTMLNMMPHSIEGIRFTPAALKSVAELFNMFALCQTNGMGGMVMFSGILEKDLTIQLLQTGNLSFFKAAFLHEVTHYLAFQNALPFDGGHETITQAISTAVLLVDGGVPGLMEPLGDHAESKKIQGDLVALAEKRAGSDAVPPNQAGITNIVQAYLRKHAPDVLKGTPAQVQDQIQRMSGVYLGAFAWAHWKKDKEINVYKLIIDYGKRHLPRVRNADYRRNLTYRDRLLIDELIREKLAPVAQVTLPDAQVRFVPRSRRDLEKPGKGTWNYERLPDHKLHYIPWDLIEYGEDASVGLTLQEIFRSKFSSEDVIEEDFNNLYFRLLFGIAETNRFVAHGLSENPGRVEEIEAFYRKKLRIMDLEIEKERMAEKSQFVQFLDGLLYALMMTKDEKEIVHDPRVTDTEVKAALDNAIPILFGAVAMDKQGFYEVVRDEVWPAVQKLLEQDLEKLKRSEEEKQAINDMLEKGEIEIADPDEEMMKGKSKPKPGDKIKISLSSDGEGDFDMDDLSEKARENLQKAIDEHLKKMSAKEREELAKKAGAKAKQEMGKQAREAAGGMSDVTGERRGKPSGKGKPQGSGKPGGNLEQDVKDLHDLADQIEKEAGAVERAAEDAQKNAGKAGTKAGAIDRQGGGNSAQGQGINDSVEELIEKLKELREKARRFQDKAEEIGGHSDDLNDGLEGEKLSDKAQDLRDKMRDKSDAIERLGQELNDKAAEADEIAHESAAQGEKLKEMLDMDPKRVDSIKGHAQDIQKKINEVREKLNQVRKDAEEAVTASEQLSSESGELQEQIKRDTPIVSEGEEDENNPNVGDPGGHISARKKEPRDNNERKRVMAKDKKGTSGPKHSMDPKINELIKEYLEDNEDIDFTSAAERDLEQKQALDQYTGLTEGQRVAYNKIRDISAEYESTLREEILNALDATERSDMMRRQRKGRIDPRRLSIVETGITDPFQIKREANKKKLRISILIDVSGSMYHDPNNLDLQNPTSAMLASSNRINNAIKVVILFLEAFREDPRVEIEVGAFASTQKIFKKYEDPITDELIYKLIDQLLNHNLGQDNSDLAGLSMIVISMREREAKEGPAAKLVTVVADGGIHPSDRPGIEQILTENTDIAFMAFGIGSQAADVKNAYAPFGRSVNALSKLVEETGEWLKEQADRLMSFEFLLLIGTVALFFNSGPFKLGMPLLMMMLLFGSVLGVVVPSISITKNLDTENFEVVPSNGDRYLQVKNGKYPTFKAKINGEGINIPNEEMLETETNVKDVVKIIKRVQRQYLDRSPLYIEGEAGTGKNKKIYYSAKLMRKSVRFMALHEDVHEDDLVERRGVGEKEHGKTDWILQPLVEAMRNGDWIIFDEVNKAKPEVMARLNQIVQSRRVMLHDGTEVTAKEGFAIIMTGNPPPSANDAEVYHVNKQSAEMLDRLRGMRIGYLPDKEELQLLLSILMKRRGYTDVKQIPAADQKFLKELIDAANLIRDNYEGLDKATGRSRRGKMIARPLSTRSLVNITKRLADFPDDRKRPRSLVRRFYSYEWSKPAQIKAVEAALDNKLTEKDEDLIFNDKDLKGPEYTEEKGVRYLKFKGIKVKAGPGAPAKLADIPLDMRVTWTETNLRYLYELMMDFGQENHMLLIGEAGTGKDLLAEYLCYALHGPKFDTFGVTRNAMAEDLVAYLGLGEGTKMDEKGMLVAAGKHETGIVPAYVVRAMEAGRPIILDEINKGKPEVFAVLNNILEYKWIDLANGRRVHAQPGFMIIATMNPSNKKAYLGNFDLSGEFLDRFSVHKFDYLKPGEEATILSQFNDDLIAEDGLRFGKIRKEVINRLVATTNVLREKYRNNRLPHPVSMRAEKRMIVTLAEYPEEYKDLNELLEECFVFSDPVHRQAVLEAAKAEKLGELKDIIEVRIGVGDAEIDAVLEKIKSESEKGHAPDEWTQQWIQLLRRLDGLLGKKSAAKKLTPELRSKTKAILERMVATLLPPPLAGRALLGALINHVRSRLDGVEVPELPEITSEMSHAEWGNVLQNLTVIIDFTLLPEDFEKKTLIEKSAGVIVVPDRKPTARMETIGGATFLVVNGVANAASFNEAASLALQVYAKAKMGEGKGVEKFPFYYRVLKAAHRQKPSDARMLGKGFTESGLPKEFIDNFIELNDSSWRQKNAMLVNRKRNALMVQLDSLKISDQEKKALLIALKIFSASYDPLTKDVDARLSKLTVVSSRLGFKKEKPAGAVDPIGRVDESSLAAAFEKALERFKAQHADLYEELLLRITPPGENTVPQIYWANNLPSAAGIVEIEGITGLMFDPGMKSILKAELLSKDKLRVMAVVNLFYLLLVHEAMEVSDRKENDTLRPNFLSEIKAVIAEAYAFSRLSLDENQALGRLYEKLDAGKGHRGFGLLWDLLNKFKGAAIECKAGLMALMDLLMIDPDYAGAEKSPDKIRAELKASHDVDEPRKVSTGTEPDFEKIFQDTLPGGVAAFSLSEETDEYVVAGPDYFRLYSNHRSIIDQNLRDSQLMHEVKVGKNIAAIKLQRDKNQILVACSDGTLLGYQLLANEEGAITGIKKIFKQNQNPGILFLLPFFSPRLIATFSPNGGSVVFANPRTGKFFIVGIPYPISGYHHTNIIYKGRAGEGIIKIAIAQDGRTVVFHSAAKNQLDILSINLSQELRFHNVMEMATDELIYEPVFLSGNSLAIRLQTSYGEFLRVYAPLFIFNNAWHANFKEHKFHEDPTKLKFSPENPKILHITAGDVQLFQLSHGAYPLMRLSEAHTTAAALFPTEEAIFVGNDNSFSIWRIGKKGNISGKVVSSRLGFKKEKPAGAVEPVGRVAESALAAVFAKALERLKSQHPDLHGAMIKRITPSGENAVPQIYWAENLPSAAGVIEIDGLTGVMFDSEMKPVLEAFQGNAQEERAIENLFYLLLVHEAKETASRKPNEAITPHIHHEMSAVLEEVRSYLKLTMGEVKTLDRLFIKLDEGKLHEPFRSVIRIYDLFTATTDLLKEGWAKLLALIKQDDEYSGQELLKAKPSWSATVASAIATNLGPANLDVSRLMCEGSLDKAVSVDEYRDEIQILTVHDENDLKWIGPLLQLVQKHRYATGFSSRLLILNTSGLQQYGSSEHYNALIGQAIELELAEYPYWKDFAMVLNNKTDFTELRYIAGLRNDVVVPSLVRETLRNRHGSNPNSFWAGWVRGNRPAERYFVTGTDVEFEHDDLGRVGVVWLQSAMDQATPLSLSGYMDMFQKAFLAASKAA